VVAVRDLSDAGLLVAPVIALACILGPVQILSLSTGTRLFRLASAKTYRRVAYGIILIGALVSMPISIRCFDDEIKALIV
jgi:hypothetical protein